MAPEPTDNQEDILTALDREAGWQAARRAEQRARELKRQLSAVSDHMKIARPRLDAWFRITKILKTEAPPEDKLAAIQVELNKATVKAASVEFEIQAENARAYRDEQEKLEAAQRAGADTHA
jgi:ribosomal 50S subunit-recycling heat shock protein